MKFVCLTGISILMVLFSCEILSAQFTFSTGTANTTNSGQRSVRLLNGVNTTSPLSQYGGTLQSKVNATGFFYTTKINGVWYLVDPDGHLFFTVGVNSVSKGGGVVLPDLLRNIGTNTLGCWSDETINDDTSEKMAYCPRWNFMQTYKNKTQRGKDLFAKGIIPVFDPGYVDFCDNHAMQLSGTSEDPFLLGHFSDNELPIYDNTTYGNLLDRYLAITDKNDPNYLAAHNWMTGRKGSGYTISTTDRELFHGFVTGTYYRITGEAIKKHDPNHLYLGSRLHGSALSKPSIYAEAGKYVDVISINYYNAWTPSKTNMDMWTNSGKPFFITEFYAKAQDSGLPNQGGAGWLVPTQDDRAKFFENFTLALIEHPGCVGYHYFRYIDDGEANKGLIDGNYKWYEPMKNSFYKIARDIYGLREFFLGKTTGMLIPDKENSIWIIPNNTKGGMTIKGSENGIPYNLELFTLSGVKLKHKINISLPYVIETGRIPAGRYIVRVSGDNQYFTQHVFLTN
jgi:hypothetical protein